jgi:cobalt-zinc-cadmium efflux system outer membrane protein
MRLVAACLIFLLGVCCTLRAQESSVQGLTLDRATEIAERNSPDLREANALIKAAEGRALQAGTLPNPELIVRGESLGATDGEYLAGVAQEIPVNGSLRKSRRVEDLEGDRLAREVEVKRFELRKRVQGAFATALFQSSAHGTVLNISDNAAKAVSITKSRVEAGDALPADLARTEMEAALSQAEVKRSRALQDQAFTELASIIGRPQLKVDSLEGELETAFSIPAVEALSREVANHPSIAASAAALKSEQARLDLEKARRIPNIRAELLYRRIQAEERDGFDIGFSVPLPLFDRNKGNIRAAEAQLAAAEARAQASSNELHATVRQLHARLTAALEIMRLQKNELLPRANEVLKVAEVRYQNGDISLTEVLVARRDRAELELAHLESLRDAAATWADLMPYYSVVRP